MSYIFDFTPATTPIQPSIVPKDTATASSIVRDTTIARTVYEYKKAYETDTGKVYKFKTQEERLRYITEAINPANCPT